jgi:hypothetical protein
MSESGDVGVDPGGGGWKPLTEEEPQPGAVTRALPGASFQGEVRGFRERTETYPSTNPLRPNQETHVLVWSFRLERYEGGTRLEPIPVEMAGESFSGSISEGDEVALYDEWEPGETVVAKRVYNVTSDTEVAVVKRWPTGQIIGSTIALVFGLSVMLFVFIRAGGAVVIG